MPDTTTPIAPDEARTFSEVDRAAETRVQREIEQDAKMERRIRIAMAAKEDSEGNCFFCGKALEVDGDVKLHPMPYLDCKGPPIVSDAPVVLSTSGRVSAGLAALPAKKQQTLPDLKPVVRPFGERD